MQNMSTRGALLRRGDRSRWWWWWWGWGGGTDATLDIVAPRIPRASPLLVELSPRVFALRALVVPGRHPMRSLIKRPEDRGWHLCKESKNGGLLCQSSLVLRGPGSVLV